VGYSADIEVLVAVRDNVLRIPTAALMPGNRVMLLTAAGLLEERRVEAGLSNWGSSPRSAPGLARGDRLVASLERAGVKAGARAVEEAKTEAKTAPAK